MLENITVGPEDIPVGTPAGNALVLASVERETVGNPRRERILRDWEAARAMVLHAVTAQAAQGSSTLEVLENPRGFYLDLLGRLCKPKLSSRYARLDEPGSGLPSGDYTSPYGVADSLENMLAYLEPFVAHPTRRFLILFQVHRPHLRVATGPGAVVSAVAGGPVSCALRWRKQGPYVGTAIPDPEEHGPEYLCDVPDREFFLFNVHEWESE